MVFKKPGNSRDDKSSKPSGKYAKGDSAKRASSPSRSRSGASDTDKSDADRPKKRYNNDSSGEKKSYSRKPSGTSYGPGDKPVRKFSGDTPSDKKPFGAGRSRLTGGRDGKPAFGDRPKRTYNNDTPGDKRPVRPPSTGNGYKKREGDSASEIPFRKRPESSYASRPARERRDEDTPNRIMRSRKKQAEKPENDGLIRLNRYISNAGICSRRKADELIVAGVISVNGEVVNELGFKVNPQKDIVRYNGETLKREKMVYVLLNKPKDYITTTDDPQERRTVMHLVEKASKERIYPVGRLDRNTTGLLLMTNDGDLADKLSHPRNSVVKLYQVELSKALTQGDLNKIGFGLELEDGLIKPDMVSYVAGASKKEVGIQIHSGKNRIVRRIFEHLGYEVVKLDRTIYANLTKKDLPRGRWRYLEEEEIIQLKHLIK
jgi:23S rRNA pseudouridine2605 synthase